MPILIEALTNQETIKQAVKKIARDAQSLQNPSGKIGRMYVDAVPAVADLEEGQCVFYISGATVRIYTKINNTIYYWNLST